MIFQKVRGESFTAKMSEFIFQFILVNQPETGMGYQVCTIRLRDGREFKQAIVDSGFVSKIKDIDGIPGLLIIFGVYKIFSGRTLKKSTKSPLDSILGGNAHEKDESDELPYIFCPRCRKQLLIELKYKHCPNCGYNLK